MKCYGTKLGVTGRRQGKLGWDGMDGMVLVSDETNKRMPGGSDWGGGGGRSG